MAATLPIAYRVAMNADPESIAALTDAAGQVTSPCTGICRIGSRQHCIGCGRSLDEIAAWSAAPSSRRLQIRAQAAERLRLYPEPIN